MKTINDLRSLPHTIDLDIIRQQERMEQWIEMGIIERPKEPVNFKFILTVMLVLIIIPLMFIPFFKANASEDDIIASHGRFINRFPLEKTVIGCYNDRTLQVRQDTRCIKGGDHNIKLPGRSQIVVWLKYYSEHQILNRLALVNFESDFNIYASNPYARGYVQTLRSHGVAIDIDSQLAWLKNRETKTYAKLSYAGKYGQVRGCGYYWNNYNFKDKVEAGEYAVLTCMYRYHYDANNGTWYGIRGVKATKFYKLYLFGITN